MKKTLTGTLALLAGASVVYGQGSLSFGNYGAAATYLYVGLKSGASSIPLGGSGSTSPTPTLSNYALETGNGSAWTVALYGAIGAGVPSANLSPLAGETSTFELGVAGVDNLPGTWASTAIYTFTPTTSPTTVTLQLYAWYNDGGALTSYASAFAAGVPTGFSAEANLSLAFPPATPAGLPGALGNFTVGNVPEPSTVALGVIGASTFLMRLRRKK